MALKDANGEERKGIYTDMLCDVQYPHCPVWFCATGIDCYLISTAFALGPIGICEREQQTVRDLMLAGF